MNALVLLLAGLLFFSGLSMLVWVRKHIRNFEDILQKQTAAQHLVDELTALNAGSIGMGGRFLKMERESHSLASRLEEVQSQIHSNSPYGQAITLAQKGSSIEEIMGLCDVSYNEAELIVMMHKHKKVA